jgi:hypothetical protein
MNVYPAFRFPFAVALAIAIAGAARQPQARLIVAETAVILVFSAAWQFLAVYAVEGVYNPLKRRAAAVTCVMVGAVLAAATIWEVSHVLSKAATNDAFFWILFRAGLGSALFVGTVCARRDLRLRRLV